MRRQVKKERKKKLRALKIKREKNIAEIALLIFLYTLCTPLSLPSLTPFFLGGVLVTCDAAAHLKNCPGEKLQLPLLVKEYAPRARARDG